MTFFGLWDDFLIIDKTDKGEFFVVSYSWATPTFVKIKRKKNARIYFKRYFIPSMHEETGWPTNDLIFSPWIIEFFSLEPKLYGCSK